MSIHHGVSCDFCRKINFSGGRYKCLICTDFDLCSTCHEKKVHHLPKQIHSIQHPMQLILTSKDYEHIYFGHIHTSRSPMSLTCPLCNENGFSLNTLTQHVNEQHLRSINSVLCPICFIRQNRLAEHLNQHTNDNILIKTKTIQYLKTGSSDQKEMKTNEHFLLGKLFSHSQKMAENEERILFIHSLLTDLLSRKSFNQSVDIDM